MAPDPFSSLVLLIIFMFAGAYLRAAEAAARLVDETAFPKDSPAPASSPPVTTASARPTPRSGFCCWPPAPAFSALFRTARPVAGKRVPCAFFRLPARWCAFVAGGRRRLHRRLRPVAALRGRPCPGKDARAHAGAGELPAFPGPSPSCCAPRGWRRSSSSPSMCRSRRWASASPARRSA